MPTNAKMCLSVSIFSETLQTSSRAEVQLVTSTLGSDLVSTQGYGKHGSHNESESIHCYLSPRDRGIMLRVRRGFWCSSFKAYLPAHPTSVQNKNCSCILKAVEIHSSPVHSPFNRSLSNSSIHTAALYRSHLCEAPLWQRCSNLPVL